MRRIITLVMAAVVALSSYADTFRYSFNAQPLAKALTRMADEHPDIEINFIYNELENYKTSANVNTSDPYEALRRVIGLNPVTIIQKGKSFYIEALQHGKYCYTGRASGTDNEPVIAATVMLLAPKDSTVITYGITDEAGRFSIPCDRKGIIAKLTCIGYQPTYRKSESFSLGTIIMPEKALALKEVKVDAEMQWTSTNASTYIPSKRQKEVSQDAVALLSHMAIPQLNVDPVGQSVSTASGQPISIFIDYVSATAQDLSGMRTTDVKKVEYLLNPQDIRFKGAQYVVNFIMQKYEWGGYTKLHADKSFCVNRTIESVYSKMKYKRMTFDIFVDENYLTNRHIGQNLVEHFKFTDLYGDGPLDVTRTSETKASLYRNNSNDISLRTYYNTENFEFSNRVAYSLENTPHNDLHNILSYSSDLMPMSESFIEASSRDWALTYNGNYFFLLSKLAALNLDANYTHGNNKSYSHYCVPDNLSIINNAHEDIHKFSVYLHFNWNPNKANQSFTNVGVQHSWNIINYLGNSPSKQNYHVGIYFFSQNYQHIFNEHWIIGGGLGWIWETNRISGVKANNNFPQTNINGTWSPNDKNQLYLTANYGSMYPGASQKSPNMLQQDELMWYRGTPELKDYNYTNATLSYTWLPNNKWQFSADGYFSLVKNRCVTLYSPIGPDGTMLRQYFNGGNYYSNYIGISATGNFFGGKLIAKLRPQFWIRKTTGDYAWNRNQMTSTAQLTYYWGNFYIFGWYMTPSKYQQTHSGIIKRTPSKYQISVGWGKDAWNINVSSFNFTTTSWKNYEESLTSKYYSFDRITFDTQHHSQYTISVTYTIGYGKKVQHNDETSGAGTAGSAILK